MLLLPFLNFRLPYEAFIELLPVRTLTLPTGSVDVNWGVSTSTKGITIFHQNSRGIAISTEVDEEALQKLRERTTEPPGTPIRLRTRAASGPLRPGVLGQESRVRIYMAAPLKLAIYGYVLDVEADPNALPVYQSGRVTRGT